MQAKHFRRAKCRAHSAREPRIIRRHAGPPLVGQPQQRPVRGARSMAGTNCDDVHGRKHARAGRSVEREGPSEWIFRRAKRGLQYQRAGAPRGYSRLARIRPVCAHAGIHPGKRQSRYSTHRTELDVQRAAPPFPLANAARIMRVHGRYHIYQTPALCAKFMGRSSVPQTGQHIIGLVTDFRSPFTAGLPSAAP
jgi:hypothetical protein